MSIRFTMACLACSCVALFAAGWTARADDPPTAEIKPGDVAVDPALQELVKQLDAKKKDEREAAAAKLKEAGAAAIPALEEGALQSKRDIIIRSIEVLRELAQGVDPAAQAKAVEAMQRLAKSKSPIAVKRVKDLMKDTGIGVGQIPNGDPAIRSGGSFGFGIFGGQGGDGTGEGKGNFSVQVGNPPGSKVKKYLMRGNSNGNERDIEVEEQDRTIKIHIDPQGEIKIEISEMKDGKPATRSVEAKDAAELKDKDVAAHRDFETYRKPPNGFQFAPFPGGAIGGTGIQGVPPLPALPEEGASRESLQGVLRDLEKAADAIRRNKDLPQAMKPLQVENVQAQIRMIRERLKSLEKEERAKKKDAE